MSAAVESMAFTNETPWHGLGNYVAEAPGIDEMLEVAGLNWSVELERIRTVTGKVIPDRYAIVRSSDKRVLDIVGKRYKPVQNKDTFEFFREFVEAGDATLETAGSLKEGEYVWCLAKLGESFEISSGDEVKPYLLMCNPYKLGLPLLYKFTTVRVVCQNTLTAALADKTGWKMRHSSPFTGVKIDEAKAALGIAREQMSEFQKNAKLLQKLNLSWEDACRIIIPAYQPGADIERTIMDFEKEASLPVKKIARCYKEAPGAELDTAWGALNAVTYYEDHVSGRNPDNRLASSWIGQGSSRKDKVVQGLLELV